MRSNAIAGLMLGALVLAGCGGHDKSPTADESSTVQDSEPAAGAEELAAACDSVRAAAPTAEVPSEQDLATASGVSMTMGGQFPEASKQRQAFEGLAAAYDALGLAAGGQELLDAEEAQRDAIAAFEATCGGDSAGAGQEPALDPLAGMFPKGFPKKVPVSKIPSPINSQYGGDRFAVQLAPGVYTALPPGATVQDAALTNVMDGFCASITTYSRSFRGGAEFGGSCW